MNLILTAKFQRTLTFLFLFILATFSMKIANDEETLAQLQRQRYQEQRLIAQEKLKNVQSKDENMRKSEKPKEMKMTDQKLSKVKIIVHVNRHVSSVKLFLDMETKEISREDRDELVEIAIQDVKKGNSISIGPFGCISDWNFLEANPFVNDILFEMSQIIDVEKRIMSKTPLMIASLFKAEKAVTKLIERGAQIDAFDKERYTALHFAVYYGGSLSCCKVLLKNGANINFQNKFGGTPLMRAARYGDVEVVKLLLEFGADVKIENKFGDTALQLAKGCCRDLIQAKMRENTVAFEFCPDSKKDIF